MSLKSSGLRYALFKNSRDFSGFSRTKNYIKNQI